MTTLFEEVEKFFISEGISYEIKGVFFLCSLDGRQFYYSPKTGKWRMKGKSTWFKSTTPFDFVVQARQYSPPNYKEKSQYYQKEKTQKTHQNKSKDYSQDYYNYWQNNHQTYSNKYNNCPSELRPEFIKLFEECLIIQRARNYKIGWIWITLSEQITPTALEICWLSVVFGYSIGWAYYRIKEFYGQLDYNLLTNVIKDNQQQWLQYFLETWGTNQYQQKQQEEQKQRKQKQQQQNNQRPTNKRAFTHQYYLDALKLTYPITLSELKKAYRQRAKETHPDLGGTAEAFRQVNTAYEVLITII